MIELNLHVTKEFYNGSKILFGSDKKDHEEKKLILEKQYLYCIQGENGLGKTTLLNIISMLTGFSGGYFKNEQGRFVLNGHNDARDKDLYRKNDFSYIFQDPHILNTYTIEENIKLVNPTFEFYKDLTKINGKITDSITANAGYLKKKIEYIRDRAKSSPFYLSGGEKQLLSFIRAMVKPSRILFADEPWANMDQELKDFVEEQLFLYLKNEDLFAEFRKANIKDDNIVIIITHSFHHTQNFLEKIDKGWNKRFLIEMYKNKENELKLEKANYVTLHRYKI